VRVVGVLNISGALCATNDTCILPRLKWLVRLVLPLRCSLMLMLSLLYKVLVRPSVSARIERRVVVNWYTRGWCIRRWLRREVVILSCNPSCWTGVIGGLV